MRRIWGNRLLSSPVAQVPGCTDGPRGFLLRAGCAVAFDIVSVGVAVLPRTDQSPVVVSFTRFSAAVESLGSRALYEHVAYVGCVEELLASAEVVGGGGCSRSSARLAQVTHYVHAALGQDSNHAMRCLVVPVVLRACTMYLGAASRARRIARGSADALR